MGRETRQRADRAVARKHHYLPQSYLRNFLQDSNSHLQVYDLDTGTRFRSATDGIACARDYFAVTGSGDAKDAFEQQRARVEGVLAPALKRLAVEDFSQFEQDLPTILWLLAMIHCDSPAERDNSHRFWRELRDLVTGTVRATNRDLEETKITWIDGETEFSVADLKAMTEDAALNDHSVTASVDHELHAQAHRLLLARDWGLSIAGPGAGHFLTVDHPAVLAWAKTPQAKWDVTSLASRETQVIFPISPTVVLSGNFGRGPDVQVVRCAAPAVALTNAYVMRHARRWVYAPHNDCSCVLRAKNTTSSALWTEEASVMLVREAVGRIATLRRARNGLRR